MSRPKTTGTPQKLLWFSYKINSILTKGSHVMYVSAVRISNMSCSSYSMTSRFTSLCLCLSTLTSHPFRLHHPTQASSRLHIPLGYTIWPKYPRTQVVYEIPGLWLNVGAVHELKLTSRNPLLLSSQPKFPSVSGSSHLITVYSNSHRLIIYVKVSNTYYQ